MLHIKIVDSSVVNCDCLLAVVFDLWVDKLGIGKIRCLYGFLWLFRLKDNRTGIEMVVSSAAIESLKMCQLRATLVIPGLSYLLMMLLHEDELFSQPLDLLFQVCCDNGQVIQGLSETLNLNFQVFLEGVFIFIPLIRRKERAHLLVEGCGLYKGSPSFRGDSRTC